MVENRIVSEVSCSKLEADFSRRDFIKSGGYVGIIAHQSALRKGEQIKIPLYDRPMRKTFSSASAPNGNVRSTIKKTVSRIVLFIISSPLQFKVRG